MIADSLSFPLNGIDSVTGVRSRTMLMHNPPHPDEIIREFCVEPLGLTVTDAAAALGVTRKTLPTLLNGRAGISPEMAWQLSKVFDART